MPLKLILTHERADFDAVASLWAAHRLYPASVPLLPKRLNRNVRAFVEAYADDFNFYSQRKSERNPFEQRQRTTDVVVVDTPVFHYVRGIKRALPVERIDHHVNHASQPDWKNQVEAVGATITLLAERLQAESIALQPLEATLMLLGLYEDTGRLTFGLTTPRDMRVAAWLIGQAADLTLVEQFLHVPLSDAQAKLLALLVDSAETITLHDHTIYLAHAPVEDAFEDEFSTVVNRLRDSTPVDALVVAIATKGRVNVSARSSTDAVDVGKLAKRLGGGGHSRAAAATVRGLSLAQLIDAIKAKLPDIVHAAEEESAVDMAAVLARACSPAQRDLIATVSHAASTLGLPLYLVGGFVRDMLVGQPSNDLDFVVEGAAKRLAKQVAETLGGDWTEHTAFGTATWHAPSGDVVDFVTARMEYYAAPATLPIVTPAALQVDLMRRDFSINTLALPLTGALAGRLIDNFNAQADLDAGLIRGLHKFSFIDDPTRILRAVRYEQRLGFALESETLGWMTAGLPYIAQLTPVRVWHEIEQLLAETQAAAMLTRCATLGVLTQLVNGLSDAVPAGFSAETKETRFVLWWLSQSEPVRDALLDRLNVALGLRNSAELAHSLIETLQPLPSNTPLSQVDRLLQPAEAHPVALNAVRAWFANGYQANWLQAYQTEWRTMTPLLNGHDLQEMGLLPGPQFKTLLAALRAAQLDGELTSKAEARQFIASLTAQNDHS